MSFLVHLTLKDNTRKRASKIPPVDMNPGNASSLVSCALGADGQHVLCSVMGPSSTPGFVAVRHHALVTHVHESAVFPASDAQLQCAAQPLVPDLDDLAEDLFALMVTKHGTDDDGLQWTHEEPGMEDGSAEEPSKELEHELEPELTAPDEPDKDEDQDEVVYLKTVPAVEVEHVMTVSSAAD